MQRGAGVCAGEAAHAQSGALARRRYRRTHLGTTGGLGLLALDLAMLAAVSQYAPAIGWPMTAAIAASLTRVAVTLPALPAAVRRR